MGNEDINSLVTLSLLVLQFLISIQEVPEQLVDLLYLEVFFSLRRSGRNPELSGRDDLPTLRADQGAGGQLFSFPSGPGRDDQTTLAPHERAARLVFLVTEIQGCEVLGKANQ